MTEQTRVFRTERIYKHTFTRLKRKQARQLNPHHLQRNSIKNVVKSLSNKIHVE